MIYVRGAMVWLSIDAGKRKIEGSSDMKRIIYLAALAAATAGPSTIALTQAPAAPPTVVESVTALFEAASRGETAPLERAIADPATSETIRVLLRARLAAGRFDPQPAREPALMRLAAAGADPALRRAALTVITSAAFASGDYAAAAHSGRLLAAALTVAGETEQAAGTDVPGGWPKC
jgi:hypothetical protein